MTLKPTTKALLFDAGVALSLALTLALITLVESRWMAHPAAAANEHYERRDDLLGGSLYLLRSKPNKEEWVARFGGSVKTEGAVRAGLDWMARHQSPDGSWSGDRIGPRNGRPHSVCQEKSNCTIPGGDVPMAQTGLAILALQAAGNYDFNNATYSREVHKGIYWLLDHQQPNGGLVDPARPRIDQYATSFMYEHAIATFALAEACAIRKAQGAPIDYRQREAVAMAVRFIQTYQHNDGGWRYSTNTGEASDASVSGWVMLALKSAIEAGIPLDPETVPRTRKFFEACATPDGRTAYIRNTGASDAMTAVGILTNLLLLKNPPTTPLVRSSARSLASNADAHRVSIQAGRPEFYALYNATLALQQVGGNDWDRWNQAVRDAVVENQSKEPGCALGSWSPNTTTGGHHGGRIYSTALATLMLEVYYRFSRKEDAHVPK